MTEKINQFKQQIIDAFLVDDLYLIEIELADIISDLYKQISICRNRNESDDYKRNLTMANTLIGICRDKQLTLRDKANALNYNFRMAAKTMLLPETYNKIFEAAKLPRSVVKSQSNKYYNGRIHI